VLTAQNTEATAGDAHRTPPASPGKPPKDESAQSTRHEEPEAGRKEVAIRITDPERGSIVLPNARRIGRSPTDGTDKTPKAAEPTVKEQQSKPNTPRRPKQRPQQPPLRLANLIPEPNVPAPPLRIQNDNGEPTASPGQSRKAHEASRRIYLLALTASSEGDFKHAITVAEDALLAGHQSVALRNNLGYCYWKTGDIEKARDHFAAALKSRSLRREEEPVVRLNWAIAATECALLDGRPLVMAEFGPLREMNRDPMAQLMTAKAMCINARAAKNNPSVAQSNFLLAGTLVRRAAELDAPTKAIRELANQFPELMGSDDFKIALRMVSRQLVPGEAAPVRLIPVSD
ncbi:MAG: tetratricopeptide repeat protein, partial [Planctomycetota bacterium]